MIEMLNLMCLAVIGVFLGVGDLLGQDNVPTGKMAAEYKALTRTHGAGGLLTNARRPRADGKRKRPGATRPLRRTPYLRPATS